MRCCFNGVPLPLWLRWCGVRHRFEYPDAAAGILQELRELDVLFHHPPAGTSSVDIDPLLTPDYWRVGASGSIYTRQGTLDVLDQRFRDGGPLVPFTLSEEAVRRLTENAYLYSYVLNYHGRSTRRATIWIRDSSTWCATYHQATVIPDDERSGPARG